MYPNKIRWKTDLTKYSDENVGLIFGGKNAKKILDSIDILKKNDYEFISTAYDHSYLNDFYPIYKKMLDSKASPNIIDIGSNVEKQISIGMQVRTLSLYFKKKFVGGSINIITDDTYINGFNAIPFETDLKLKVNNINYIRTFYHIKEAKSLSKSIYSAGRDRNFYGINSAIGLAIFKLRTGAVAYVNDAEDYELVPDFSWDGKEDVLAFEGEGKGQKITKAKLFLVKNDPEEFRSKYGSLFSQDDFEVEVITK
jgi:hypothetical protein